LIKGKGNWLKDGRFIRGGRDEKRVYACGRQGGVAGKLVADVRSFKSYHPAQVP